MRLSRADGALKRADGTEIRAELRLETPSDGDGIDIVLHSRGGASGSPQEHNPDYFEALEELLWRLGQADSVVRSIAVDSSVVAKQPESERLLDLSFPMKLSTHPDLDRLRKDITRAQQPIGQVAGAKGGNSTKRIRIRIEPGPAIFDVTSAVAWLSQSQH